MASIWTLQLHSGSVPPSICVLKHQVSSNVLELRTDWGFKCCTRKKRCGKFVLRASSDSWISDDGKRVGEIVVEVKRDKVSSDSWISDDSKRVGEIVVEVMKRDKVVDFKNQVARLQATVTSLPPVIFVMKRQTGSNFAIALCILATMIVLVRIHVAKKARYSRPGSVAELVRRGQLRSDRRGISTPLKYDDPFNNPLVKVGKSNSTVEMFGKVYRLAPVTLTREQQAIHQKRRSRAYQWKRPTVFLREGDPIPSDVEPDTIRWIPANHPFATTASDIDEDLAQNNVYQKHGVPFRIKAEHEAMQRKLEALQSQQQFKKLVIDPGAAKDFERPFKSHPKDGKIEDNQSCNPLAPKPTKLEHGLNSFGSSSTLEESQEI